MRPTAKDKLILALDVDSAERALELCDQLRDAVGMFKVGSQLFTAAGPDLVRQIVSRGAQVFLDLKFHDIPSTVAKAAIEATRFGVKMFNVHASGSLEMMRTTVKEVRRVCRQEQRRRPIMLAVTVLTRNSLPMAAPVLSKKRLYLRSGLHEGCHLVCLNLAK